MVPSGVLRSTTRGALFERASEAVTTRIATADKIKIWIFIGMGWTLEQQITCLR
jgi:hypothetical protein